MKAERHIDPDEAAFYQLLSHLQADEQEAALRMFREYSSSRYVEGYDHGYATALGG